MEEEMVTVSLGTLRDIKHLVGEAMAPLIRYNPQDDPKESIITAYRQSQDHSAQAYAKLCDIPGVVK